MNCYLNVVSIDKQIFFGIFKYIQISAKEGQLGIYAKHSPLLTTLKPGILRIIKDSSTEEYIYISDGILEIQPDIVTILVDKAIYGKNLNETIILQEKKHVQAKINLNRIDANYNRYSLELSKVIAKLRIIEYIKKQHK